MKQWLTIKVPKHSLGKGTEFPTQKRPSLRELSHEATEIINTWFENSGITISSLADTTELLQRVKRLSYTWKDCFASSIKYVKATELIEHSIDIKPHAKPIRGSLPK